MVSIWCAESTTNARVDEQLLLPLQSSTDKVLVLTTADMSDRYSVY